MTGGGFDSGMRVNRGGKGVGISFNDGIIIWVLVIVGVFGLRSLAIFMIIIIIIVNGNF